MTARAFLLIAAIFLAGCSAAAPTAPQPDQGLQGASETCGPDAELC